MAPISDDDSDDQPFNVLLTGFGPFGKVTLNPSWQLVSKFHDTAISPPIPPPSSDQPYATGLLTATRRRPIHVQSINLPTVYSSVLDVVPRLYRVTPHSPHARAVFDPLGPTKQSQAQGDGISHYPEPYQPRLTVPKDGWDLVIHVGVGLAGGYKVEKQAHKEGYGRQDAFGELPPPLSESKAASMISSLRQRLISLLHSCFSWVWTVQPFRWLATRLRRSYRRWIVPSGKGGFGKGYEGFDKLLKNRDIDVDSLVKYLKTQEIGPVITSHDPGNFVCDFTYYTSLAESRRSMEDGSQERKTKVLFIHIPPTGYPQGQDEGKRMLEKAIGWIFWGGS